MQVTTSAMAEELEKKVQSLVEGYEQLETISSKLPSSILHMANKHTKNLLGDVQILTPKDREDIEGQQQTLKKVRNDLQGMAYERVVVDVLTRDAILNAKRKNRHRSSRTPVNPRLKKTSTNSQSPKQPPDIDSPIPINPFPSPAEITDSPLQKTLKKTGSRPPARNQEPYSTEMQIGQLPDVIKDLRTTPDNPPHYRKGKSGPKKTPLHKKYRNINKPVKIPLVGKGMVEPETVLAYALANKQQEEKDEALRLLVEVQSQQAKELGDLRSLLQNIAERENNKQSTHHGDRPGVYDQQNEPPLHSQRLPPPTQFDDDIDYSSGDEVDLSKYKIITVSEKGFQSAKSPRSPQLPPEESKESDHKEPPVPEPEVINESMEVDYELVADSDAGGKWIPKSARKFQDNTSDYSSLRRHEFEDGHIYNRYTDIYSETKTSHDRLIVVNGQGADSQQRADINSYGLPQREGSVRVPVNIAHPTGREDVVCISQATSGIVREDGSVFPRSYTYSSKVIPVKNQNSDVVDDVVQKKGEGDMPTEIETKTDEHESSSAESTQQLSPQKDLETNAVPQGDISQPPTVNEDLMSLLHQLVQTQQSTMQGHNELILTLLSQQRGSQGPSDNEVIELDSKNTEMIADVEEDEKMESKLLAPGDKVEDSQEQIIMHDYDRNCEVEVVVETNDNEDINSIAIQQEPEQNVQATEPTTSFGNLLKKGPSAYSQSPSDLNNQGCKKERTISKGVMNSEVLPFYNESGDDSKATSKVESPQNPSHAVLGALATVLQQLALTQRENIDLPRCHGNDKTQIQEENKYHCDTGRPKEYFHDIPSDQRGQRYAPVRNVNPSRMQKYGSNPKVSCNNRSIARMSAASSSTDSWDDDYYSVSSCDGSDTHSRRKFTCNTSRQESLREEGDATLTMLRRDIEDSRNHRAAMGNFQLDITASDFDNNAIDESWSNAAHSSDSSLGSYHSLKRPEKAQRVKHNNEMARKARNKTKSPENWYNDDEVENHSRKKKFVKTVDESLDLPTPLCSSVLPCKATLHYANRGLSPRKEEGYPTKRPHHLRLEPRDQFVDDSSISRICYSSNSSDDTSLPSKTKYHSYRPTPSEYEPSTPSTSTLSSLGSFKLGKQSSAVRNKFEKDNSNSTTDSGSGEEHCGHVSSELDSSESEDSDFKKRYVAGDSSTDNSSQDWKVDDNNNISLSSSYVSSFDGDSVHTGCSSSASDNVAFPRSQLRLWRPANLMTKKTNTK